MSALRNSGSNCVSSPHAFARGAPAAASTTANSHSAIATPTTQAHFSTAAAARLRSPAAARAARARFSGLAAAGGLRQQQQQRNEALDEGSSAGESADAEGYVHTYEECLQRLYTQRAGVKLDLDRLRAVAVFLGCPHEDYDVIHVAGTNGKGSTCAKITACLSLKGYKVGMYTSPHLLCLRERIRVKGEMIEEEQFVSLYNRVKLASNKLKLPLSFFEIVTQIAFLYFSQQEVDKAVVETGLGGRYDATNIVPAPLCTVITSIGWDHMSTLGPTLESIAEEKAGILKLKVPVVLGPTATNFSVFSKRADKLGCELWEVKPEPRGEDFADENMRIAKAVIQHVLRVDLLPNQMETALSVQLPLRAQVLTKADLLLASQRCGVPATLAGAGAGSPSPMGAAEPTSSSKQKHKSSGPLFTRLETAPDIATRAALAAAAVPVNTRSGAVTDLPHLPSPFAVVVDVGHNVSAFDRLMQFVGHHYFGMPVRLVVSLSQRRSLSILQPIFNHLSFTNNNRLRRIHLAVADHERARTIEDLLQELRESPDISPALRCELIAGLEEQHQALQQMQQLQQHTKVETNEEQPLEVLQQQTPSASAKSPESLQSFSKFVSTCGKGSLPDILRFAYRTATIEQSILVVTGSFFISREVATTFGFLQGPTDPFDMNERSAPGLNYQPSTDK